MKKSPLSKLKKKLWDLCRTIIRARYGNTCYTCGRTGLTGSDWQTGHFISSSICSTELRYALDNLRIQCAKCNIWKSGNWLEFEQHLKRDGVDVEELKQRNIQTKGKQYGTDWYLSKIGEYERIVRSL